MSEAPRLRVLVVDDSAPMRRFISSLIEELPADVHEVSDGSAALAEYESWLPDVVLMDIRMPVMDGIETTRALHDAHPEAVVIMVTDYDSPAFRRDAASAGACDYVLKQELHLLADAVLRAVLPN